MDTLMDTLTLIERVRLLLPLVDERNKAEQRGERERASGLGQQVEFEIQSIVAEIKLLREKEQLPE